VKKILLTLVSAFAFLLIFNGIFTSNTKLTSVGGYAVNIVNRTGTNSIKGQVVAMSVGADDVGYVMLTNGMSPAIGVVFEDDEDDGDPTFVAISGIAEVLLASNALVSNGYYIYGDTNADAGYAYGSATEIADQADYFLGYCLENLETTTNYEELATVLLKK